MLQDEHFLDRPRWDFDGTPAERYPLLLHHHPLELYRHQVIKQTDVVLATYLLDRSFSKEEIRRTFDYQAEASWPSIVRRGYSAPPWPTSRARCRAASSLLQRNSSSRRAAPGSLWVRNGTTRDRHQGERGAHSMRTWDLIYDAL